MLIAMRIRNGGISIEINGRVKLKTENQFANEKSMMRFIVIYLHYIYPNNLKLQPEVHFIKAKLMNLNYTRYLLR